MKRVLVLALVGWLGGVSVASAITVSMPASKDNTLYESATGDLSNGAGDYVFTGITRLGFARRTVMGFDVAGTIPAGSTINSVTLRLYMSRGKENTPFATTLHAVLAEWGEGTSNADGEEGAGIASTTNDATWIHRFYPGSLWTTAGGDFVAGASASTVVSIDGYYDWTSAGMVLDAQMWLDTPASNHGWIMLGDETDIRSSKRFSSRTNPTLNQRPELIVDFTPPGGGTLGACCLPSGCEILSPDDCATLAGDYQGDNTSCSPDPCVGAPITVALQPSKDNTLYQNATGAVSNGMGPSFHVGRTNGGVVLRTVLAFDLSTIPSNATITGASLTMVASLTSGGATNVTLHKALADWGEGTSVAGGDESAGAASTTGDATWIHRFYSGTLWSTAGGDFNATASATTSVSGAATYVWTSAGLLSDVQAWHANASTNFGWVARGVESGNTKKRFNSRQFSDPALRPKLEVTYVVQPTGACCSPGGLCDELTEAACLAANGTYHGDGSTCIPDLCPVVLEPYVDALPLPGPMTPTSGTIGGTAEYTIPIREVQQQLHRDLPPTTVWGYNGLYPGPTIEASVDQPVTVTWVNDLRDGNGVLRTTHFLPVDLCMKGPDTEGATPRVVSHLHGAHVEHESDGYPEDTILPGEQQVFHYPNHQLAATLWYHDHAMGITRLNVMMGLAGFYLLRDAVEMGLGLPAGEYEVPLAIQDRSFNPDGSLKYPAMWDEHFFGDVILVNGKVWPYLNVKQGKYRFRVLGGSNSRVYQLSLSNGAPFVVIGTEGGLLEAPIVRNTLLVTPGERYDVIVDFAAYAPGTEIILENSAPAPYPGSPGVGVIPNVMKFIVVGAPGHTDPIPATLRPMESLPESESVITRDLVLAKQSHPCSGSMWTINGKGFDEITEFPVLDTAEIWRFVNNSGSVHPMHMHLTMFQILDRQAFVMVGDSVVPVGDPILPDASEAGWKDTAPVFPDQMMRVIARFEDYTGKFPYHCHVLEHEDNEMMRQFEVVLDTTATGVKPIPSVAYLGQCYPNPFNPSTRIEFSIPQAARVRLDVYDVHGRLVATLVDRQSAPGMQSVVWNGRDRNGAGVASGVYFYRLTLPGQRSLTRKLVLLK